MILLLKLYPRSWRERYGDELADLVRHQSWTPALVIDLIAGAIDARLHPQLVTAVKTRNGKDTRGEEHMFAKMMKFRCAGYAPNVSPRDQWLSVAGTLGGTLALTLIWMRLHVVYGDSAYVDSFLYMTFLVPYILTLPLTSLKGRSRGAQAIFIGGMLAVLTGIGLVAGFIAARL